MSRKIVAIVGSYRNGKVTDTLVSQVVRGAARQGAEVSVIYLRDRNIAFCTNCRSCTQSGPEFSRGQCPIEDDVAGICGEIDGAAAIVLAAPINFGTVTALMKRFIERLVCYACWPWGGNVPRQRIKTRSKKALLVTSTAAPAALARLAMGGALRPMKWAAASVGAKVVDTLWIGMVASRQDPILSQRALERAARAGERLARA